jgi:hypothetical protein
MRLSLKESRMKLLNAANLDRKSGIRGPKMMGEAPPQLLVPDPARPHPRNNGDPILAAFDHW